MATKDYLKVGLRYLKQIREQFATYRRPGLSVKEAGEVIPNIKNLEPIETLKQDFKFNEVCLCSHRN